MVLGRSDHVLYGKMCDLHPYFSGPCELHFRILGGHGRLVGSSHQTIAQISSVDPITEGNILLPWHMQLFGVSSALKRSQKVLKVGGIVKIRVAFSRKWVLQWFQDLFYSLWAYIGRKSGTLWDITRYRGIGLSLHYVEGEVVLWSWYSWEPAVVTMKVVRHSGTPSQVTIILIFIDCKHWFSMCALRMRRWAWNSWVAIWHLLLSFSKLYVLTFQKAHIGRTKDADT